MVYHKFIDMIFRGWFFMAVAMNIDSFFVAWGSNGQRVGMSAKSVLGYHGVPDFVPTKEAKRKASWDKRNPAIFGNSYSIIDEIFRSKQMQKLVRQEGPLSGMMFAGVDSEGRGHRLVRQGVVLSTGC